MTLFLLNSDNIEHAKFELRSALPDVKASHRVEALAAAIGYRTFASLLADLRQHAPLRRAAKHVEPVRFSARLLQLGYESVDPSPITKIARSMPLRPWAEYKAGDRDANDRWFRECQRRNIPNIYIETRSKSKYVTLNWDCIAQDSEHDVHRQADDGANFVRQMFSRFQSHTRHASGKPEFFGSSFVGSIDRLMPEIARELAEEFFMMFTIPIKEEGRPPLPAALPRSP
jgi:hypothetical protein